MPAAKPRPTLADYVTIALSPALIMAVIGSLVFFLLEVFYVGEFLGRLRWILFFYVFGMVLVARISMETGIADRAPLYAAVLAFLVWIGMGQFVNYPPELQALSWLINAGLVGLVWWSSYRLTWDCTSIDEKVEATGTGMLQAAGLEQVPAQPEPSQENSEEPGQRGKKRTPKPNWWERWQKFREERARKQPPGVWVVYFSLAALPIFGLGQSLIPPEEEGRRLNTFCLMGIYIASALGLLVTTAFLGLRRYLRQRNIQMPKAITTAWLIAGGSLILAFVVIGAVLPRPAAEFSLFDVTRLGSKEREASRYAVKGGDPGKGEGRAGAQQHDDNEGQPVNSNDPNRKGSGGKGQAQGQGSGDKGDQKGQSGDQKGGDRAGQGNDQTSNAGDRKKSQGKPADRDRDAAKEGSRDVEDRSGDEETRESSSDFRANRDRTGTRSPSSRRWSTSLPLIGRIAPVLKWIVFGLLAGLVVVFLLRGGLRYLANIFDWAKRLLEALSNFWASLFGERRVVMSPLAEDEDQGRSVPRRPFRSYGNPFEDGRADTMTPAELVRYSFEALEAWAYERDLGRSADQTPIEFADRIGDEVPALEGEAKRLAVLYARVLYARGTLPGTWRAVLEKFWQRIEAVTEQPLSA